MIKDRGDWVISRQRAWGVPLPIFYAEDGTAIVTPETIEHIAQIFAKEGSNAWYKKTAQELLPEGFTSEHSPNGKFTKEKIFWTFGLIQGLPIRLLWPKDQI